MILIVDDIPENLYSLKSVLEHNKFKVDTASSGEKALKKVLKTNYTLILLDVQMPGMDGFEVAEIISGYSKAKHTAIIFLSANYTDANFILKGYRHGAIDYITKPIDPSLLLTRVKALYEIIESRIEISRQQDEIRSLYISEKRLNQILSRQRKALLLTQKLAKVAYWEYHIETESLKCSPEIYSLLGLDASREINLRLFIEMLSAEEQEEFRAVWDRLGKKGGRLEFTHSFITESGHTLYLKQYGKLERKNGLAYKILGTVQDITEEKNNEKEFFRLYERYKLVNKATNDIICDWDVHKNEMEFNDSVFNVLGYPKKVITRPEAWWEDIVHPEDLPRTQKAFEAILLKQASQWEIECRLRCANGEYKDVVAQSYCLFNSSGQLLRMVTATKDLSSLRSIENQLMRTELRLQQTVETINEGFFTCNSSWNVTYWNHKAEEIIGLSKQEVLGKNLWDLFPQARESRFAELYSKCFETKRPCSFEEYYEPMSKWFRVNVHPSDEGIAVYFEDITEELLKELQLNKAIEKAELIKTSSQEVLWEADVNSEIVHFNKNLYLQYGYKSNTITDREWFKQRIHPEDRDTVINSLFKSLEESLDFWQMIFRFLDVHGTSHYVNAKVHIVRDENNNPVHVAGSLTNIQDLKEKESKLAQIAFSNSHLVRKPLANILGLVELLNEEDVNSKEITNMLKESVHELDVVIKQIAVTTN